MWNKLYLLKEQQAQEEDPSTGVSCLKVESCRFALGDDAALTTMVQGLTEKATQKLSEEAVQPPPPLSLAMSDRLAIVSK